MSLKHNSCNTLYNLLGFLLDDGPKPSIFLKTNLLSCLRVKMCKNIECVKGRNILIVARWVKTRISFFLLQELNYAFLKSIMLITVISDSKEVCLLA